MANIWEENELQKKRWTHWYNAKEKRSFLIIDIPMEGSDNYVLLELKEYGQDEDRKFINIHKLDWEMLVVDGKMQQFTPRL